MRGGLSAGLDPAAAAAHHHCARRLASTAAAPSLCAETNARRPTTADYDRRTTAHIACAEGVEELALTLFEYGANFHFRDRLGQTPLDEARSNGRAGLLARLEPLLARQAAEGGPRRKGEEAAGARPRRPAVAAQALTAEAAARRRAQQQADREAGKPEERQRRESSVVQAERRLSLVKAIEGDPDAADLLPPRAPRRSSAATASAAGGRSSAGAAGPAGRGHHGPRLFDPEASARPFRERFAGMTGGGGGAGAGTTADGGGRGEGAEPPGTQQAGADVWSFRTDYSGGRGGGGADGGTRGGAADGAACSSAAAESAAILRFLGDRGDRYASVVGEGGVEPEDVASVASEEWERRPGEEEDPEFAGLDDADALAAEMLRERAAAAAAQAAQQGAAAGSNAAGGASAVVAAAGDRRHSSTSSQRASRRA